MVEKISGKAELSAWTSISCQFMHAGRSYSHTVDVIQPCYLVRHILVLRFHKNNVNIIIIVVVVVVILTYYGAPQPVPRSASQHKFKIKYIKYEKSVMIISINTAFQSETVNESKF